MEVFFFPICSLSAKSFGSYNSQGLVFKYMARNWPYIQDHGPLKGIIEEIMFCFWWVLLSGNRVYIMVNGWPLYIRPFQKIIQYLLLILCNNNESENLWKCGYKLKSGIWYKSTIHMGAPYIYRDMAYATMRVLLRNKP